jgi:hypothetical protein
MSDLQETRDPSPTWRRVLGLAGGFARPAEQTRRSVALVEIIRQLFPGTAT